MAHVACTEVDDGAGIGGTNLVIVSGVGGGLSAFGLGR
jgi:hypothetical protein